MDDNSFEDSIKDQLSILENGSSKKSNNSYTHKSRILTYESNESDLDNRHVESNISIKHIDEPQKPTQPITVDMPKIVPPPTNISDLPKIDTPAEAEASMLMSWYMAGYHTGYMEAMRKFSK